MLDRRDGLPWSLAGHVEVVGALERCSVVFDGEDAGSEVRDL